MERRHLSSRTPSWQMTVGMDGYSPHRVRQERLLEKGRGLLNLCDCKVQGAYNVGLFVTVVGMYRLDTMQEGC